MVQSDLYGTLTIRQPTIFLDLALAPKGTAVPSGESLPDRHATEEALIEQALGSLLSEVAGERARETETVLRHVEISLNELIHRQNLRLVVCHGDFDRQSFPWYAVAKTGGTDGQAISRGTERR